MPQQQNTEAGAVPVTIYGHTYHLRGHGDSGYLEELAATVDARMREIADATGTADTLKVAILACLNICDESLKGQQSKPGSKDAALDKRLTRMVTLLDEVLAG